jgi:cell division protein ZapA
MNREFQIKCPEDKVANLKEAVTFLDNKMRQIHHGDKLITIDRVAIAAALNITNELILEKQQSYGVNKRLQGLKNKLSKILNKA